MPAPFTIQDGDTPETVRHRFDPSGNALHTGNLTVTGTTTVAGLTTSTAQQPGYVLTSDPNNPAANLAFTAPGDGSNIPNTAATLSRINVVATTVSSASGQVRFSYFTAATSLVASNIASRTGGTAAGATPTLCRMGVYSVDSGGNLTLIGACASDTALWAGTSTDYVRALAAPVALTIGQRYAFANVIVTGAATPTFCGNIPNCGGGTQIGTGAAPLLTNVLGGQTDLPATVASGALGASGSVAYGVLL